MHVAPTNSEVHDHGQEEKMVFNSILQYYSLSERRELTGGELPIATPKLHADALQ